jgi:GNAT superfamily N-acetyltransferase
VHPLVGVTDPASGTVLSVAPDRVDEVSDLIADFDRSTHGRLARALGGDGVVLGRGVLRAAENVPDVDVLPDAGIWVGAGDPADDPRVPSWLHPFNGGVLLHLREDGTYGAGVGVKTHDDVGRELSVVTDDDLRGQGLARRLVAQAARTLSGRGFAVTYLHDPDNVASARVADACGFPDHGWEVWGLFPAGD